MPIDMKVDFSESDRPNLSYREYAKYLSQIVWIDEIPWHLYGRILTPLCMPHVPIDVDRTQLSEAIVKSGALLAFWTTQWDTFESSEWWWTCCDHEIYDVKKINSSRGRRAVRKGLRECTVRRVKTNEFLSMAYPIYRSAVESYGESPPTEVEHVEQVKQMATYPGTEFWASFYKGRMAAFAICQVVDNAVTLGSTKSVAELNRYNPNAALYYSIAQYYLNDGRRYITNGWRTLWHPTSINDFLERIGFRKIFCKVNVQLSNIAEIIVKSHFSKWGAFFGLQRLSKKKWAQLEGFQKLVEIAETFK